MNPLQQTDANIMDDTDLAGPLVFCLAFGGFLLLVRNNYDPPPPSIRCWFYELQS